MAKRGDRVTFVDENGRSQNAEARGVINENDPLSTMNLHVLTEHDERTSVPNEAHKVAGAGFWRAL
jgi:hypothetical protein